jgi:hypothetical protein
MVVFVAGCGNACPIIDHTCSWLCKGLAYKWSYLEVVVERLGLQMVINIAGCRTAWTTNIHIFSLLWKGLTYKWSYLKLVVEKPGL